MRVTRLLLDMAVWHTPTQSHAEAETDISNENIHVAAICRPYGELLVSLLFKRLSNFTLSPQTVYCATTNKY